MILNERDVRLLFTLKKQLAQVKKQEMELRKDIAYTLLVPNQAGTVTTMVGDIEVKASQAENLSVDATELMEAMEWLTETDKAAVIWKPSINKKLYNALPSDSALKEITTIKLSAPTISIIGAEMI